MTRYVQPALIEREAVVQAIHDTETRMRGENDRLSRVVMTLSRRERRYRAALELRGCSQKEINRIRDGGDYDPADYA